MKEVDFKGVHGFRRHVIRDMAFDYAYGVRSKEGKEHPFAGVMKSPLEPYHRTTPRKEMLVNFIALEVGKYLRCSWPEYLCLPYPDAMDALELARKYSQERLNAKNDGQDLNDLVEEQS